VESAARRLGTSNPQSVSKPSYIQQDAPRAITTNRRLPLSRGSYRLSLICKSCGVVVTLSKVTTWTTTWKERNGQRYLAEIRAACPYCGAQHSYNFSKMTLYPQAQSGQKPILLE
jgi:RNase P subunit RPR2